MFFYEIRAARPEAAPSTVYLEALKPAYVGEKVAALLDNRDVTRVTVSPISQAKYVRATRAD